MESLLWTWVGLGAGGKGGSLLMPYMHPAYAGITLQRFHERVKRISRHAIDALYSCACQHFDNLV